jgi:hypothetical protein
MGLFIPALAATLQASSLTLERTIPLPGVSGRIDHFGSDSEGGRLFVAALANATVEGGGEQSNRDYPPASRASDP